MTEEDVYIYRELYYEHVKPLLRQGADDTMIDIMMEGVFEQYGWTKDKYKAFSMIDLMQRINELKSDRVKIIAGTEVLNPKDAKGLPTLRCPKRTEQFKFEKLWKDKN
jgi:hypothetical protein